MHEPARIATVIELLEQCRHSRSTGKPTPADIVLHQHFKRNRFIGSKDRAAISELFYFIIRHMAALEWWAMKHGLSSARALCIAALMLDRHLSVTEVKALFNGDRFSEAPLHEEEELFARDIRKGKLLHRDMPEGAQYNVPAWMMDSIRASLGDAWREELLALNEEAPVDLRTNTLLTTREALLEALTEEGFKVAPCPHSPIGIRMQQRAPVFTSKVFKLGWFEMQDEGSQIVSLLLDAKPGQKVIDFCAGAGGKTLAIAAQMQNKGRILAWDVSENRLNQMPERLRRAKVDNVQRHLLSSEQDDFIRRHLASADAVIVDAPCTGSGTWRRNPDLKWRTSPQDMEEILSVQQKILRSAARLVKQGGHLLYITCSFFRAENEQQIDAFISQHKNFRVVTPGNLWSTVFPSTVERGGMLRLTPHQDGTDGFFAVMLQRAE